MDKSNVITDINDSSQEFIDTTDEDTRYNITYNNNNDFYVIINNSTPNTTDTPFITTTLLLQIL